MFSPFFPSEGKRGYVYYSSLVYRLRGVVFFSFLMKQLNQCIVIPAAFVSAIAFAMLGCSVGDEPNPDETATLRIEMTGVKDDVKRYRITATPQVGSQVVVTHDPDLGDAMVASVSPGIVHIQIEGFACPLESPVECPNPDETPIIVGERTVSVPHEGVVEPVQILMQAPSTTVVRQLPLIHAMDARPSIGPMFVIREPIALELVFTDDGGTEGSTIEWEGSHGTEVDTGRNGAT